MKIRLLAGCAAVILLCSCSRRRDEVVVGSKNFTEQFVLGEIAAQQIERKLHLPVRRRLNLGGTLLTQKAMEYGDIDLYPEYTGTAASVILKMKIPNHSTEAFKAVKNAYLARFHFLWLDPLGFNNTFAMVVRSPDARALASPELSAARARSWRLGMGYEFLTRPDGLERLDSVYQVRWNGNPTSMDLGLLYQALQQNQVDMAAGNSTDAQLTESRFAVLADDKHAFPPYDACYVVRESLAREKPDVVRVLNELHNRIDETTMRNLNRQVDVEHKPAFIVARDFLSHEPQ